MPKKLNLIGQRFGRLTVIREATIEEKKNLKGVFWYCLCDCGKEKITRTACLRSGDTKSCGCYNKERIAETQHNKIIDMTGQKYGSLTVLNYDDSRPSTETAWWCQCDCGAIKSILRDSLVSGKTKSCGCLRSKISSKHLSILSSSKYINEEGNVYGKLTVLRKATYEEDKFIASYSGIWWLCKCQCGKEIIVSGNALRTGNTTSCGCNKSKGELEIENILQKNHIEFKTQFRIKYNLNIKNSEVFKFDFAIFYPSYFYFIEYDGEQHYYPIDFFGGEAEYQRIQNRDLLKNKYCYIHNIPLIRIPYTIKGHISLEDILCKTSNYLVKGDE